MSPWLPRREKASRQRKRRSKKKRQIKKVRFSKLIQKESKTEKKGLNQAYLTVPRSEEQARVMRRTNSVRVCVCKRVPCLVIRTDRFELQHHQRGRQE